jgi:hypothetical protein
VQKVLELLYFPFGFPVLQNGLDQAERHCTLGVQIGSCLHPTIQMIYAWRQPGLIRVSVDYSCNQQMPV